MKIFTIVFISILITNGYAKAQPVNIKDSLALVDLYNSTGGNNWYRNTNWLKGPVKTWYGITISNSRVMQINLEDNNLTQSLPNTICNLDALYTLDLSDNKLTGNIPDSIGNLTNLYYFSLTGNKLKGRIPASIGNLKRLYEVHLSYNYLSGSIPESICNLSNLFYLELQYNELSGKIPENIGDLFNLGNIKLNNNKLTGNIPASFRNFQSLEFFDLSYNDLSGEIIFPAQNKIPFTIYLSHNHFTENKNIMFNKFFDLLGYTLAIDNNDYTFDGIEFLSKQSVQCYYAPQAHLIAHQNNDTLSVFAGGTLKNNTYTWFEVPSHDSVAIVGDSTFRPSKGGYYYAKINNKYAKLLTLITDTIDFAKPSINNNDIAKNKYAIRVSPDPAVNSLHIEGLPSNQKIKLTVVDFSGNAAISQQLTANSNSSYNVNIASLKQGNYLLKIETNNEVVTKQFIKE